MNKSNRPDILISPLGEQPTPILLIDRMLQPKHHILLATSHDGVMRAGKNLKALLGKDRILILENTSAFNIAVAYRQTDEFLKSKGFEEANLAVNITGGTKQMALASWELARSKAAYAYYLETAKSQERLHHFPLSGMSTPLQSHTESVPELITISDYIRVHGFDPNVRGNSENQFEQAILSILQETGYEVIHSFKQGQVEIDFIVRNKNAIAFIEAKTGGSARSKSGIDQLLTASSQDYFGTFVRKMIVGDEPLPSENARLASDRKITALAIPSFRDSTPKQISIEDADKLKKAVATLLE